MKKRCLLACVLGLFLVAMAEKDRSQAVYLSTSPEGNRLWCTAFGDQVSLSFGYPSLFGAEAKSVTLIAECGGVAVTNAGLTAAAFEYAVPPLRTAGDERVVTFRAVYDNGVELVSPGIGFVRGTAIGAMAAADWAWPSEKVPVPKRVVVPLSAGATALTLDGETVLENPDGREVWAMLGPLSAGMTHTVALLSGDDVMAEASLERIVQGLFIMVK